LIIPISGPKLSALGRLPGTFQFRDIKYHPEALQPEGLLILRPNEEIFFANAASLRKAIRAQLALETRPVGQVVLIMESANELDAPGAEMRDQLETNRE
jgi:MFS superfamily sulfate permease-like transporter